MADKYNELFIELHDEAECCNNVAVLQNIKAEADALKVRCLNEISDEEARQTEADSGQGEEGSVKPAAVKRSKTISIKSINNASTWQIETEADVKRYISELERKLIDSLEENTVINIEF